MKITLSPNLSPTSCLAVDSEAARELAWLPFAVRFKLDQCGLGMSLRQWQQLPLPQRAALVRAPLVAEAGGFMPLALASGARLDASRRRGPESGPTLAGNDGGPDVATKCWLASATPFARYVLAKVASRKAAHEAA